jgi:carnitine-CoA ligase
LKGPFLKHQMIQSGAAAVVTDADSLLALRPPLGELPDCKHIIALDESHDDDVVTSRYLALDVDVDVAEPQEMVRPDDVMSIMFTSGTTGMPKGCVLSHGYYARAGRLVGDGVRLTSRDSLYSALPLFHAGGQLLVLCLALMRGLGVTIDPVFSASNTIGRAREVGATVIVGVGAMGQLMMASAGGAHDRDHGVRAMVVSPMAVDAQARFRERFGIEPWTQIYGQTECVPLALTPADEPADPAGIGRPAPDFDVRLLDDDSAEVPAGEVGEICFRSRQPFAMFNGYWNDPELTQNAYAGGWYHSGDLARIRPSGELEFADRNKDSMRRRGENVSSVEVEAAIARHPAVAEVAVHAVPSDQTEDDIKACIVLKDGADVTAEQLFEFFRNTLRYFMTPRYVDILEGREVTTAGHRCPAVDMAHGLTPARRTVAPCLGMLRYGAADRAESVGFQNSK